MQFEIGNSNCRLAGTLHFFPKDSPNLPSWLIAAYEWAQVLVLESEFAAPDRMLRPGDRLQNYLPLHVLRRASQLWDSREGPIQNMKPWAVLGALPCMILQGVPGTEAHVRAWASRDSKPLDHLEDGKDLAAAFEGIAPHHLADRIGRMLSTPETARKEMRRLHKAWFEGQYGDAAAHLPVFGDPVFYEPIFIRRNRAWLPRIISYFPSSVRVLFLVGATHLCGPENVPELVAREGWPIQQI